MSVEIELAECEGQHALRDMANRRAHFVDARGASGEEFDDQHRPLVADPREGLANCQAFLLGLLFVPRCQKSASLCERFLVTILASVTKGNQTGAPGGAGAKQRGL